jgi:hypothetical protein
MPRKVKIAPHLVKYFQDLDIATDDPIRREFRALLAVARASFPFPGACQTNAEEQRLEQAQKHLMVISKGDKSCPAK